MKSNNITTAARTANKGGGADSKHTYASPQNQEKEDLKDQLADEKRKKLQKEQRFLRMQPKINLEADFENQFKDYDQIVDAASQIFLQHQETTGHGGGN